MAHIQGKSFPTMNSHYFTYSHTEQSLLEYLIMKLLNSLLAELALPETLKFHTLIEKLSSELLKKFSQRNKD